MAEPSRFALDLKAFAEKVPQSVKTTVNKVCSDVLTKIVERTPVGNPDLWKVNIARKAKGLPNYPPGYVGGRLRGNWNVGVNQVVMVKRPVDKLGRDTVQRGQRVLAVRSEAEADIYITNSLPYAIPVEYGWSTQAPTGMVRVTVTEFQTLVNNAVAANDY